MFKIITSLTMFAIGLTAQAQTSEQRIPEPFNAIEATDGVHIIFRQAPEAITINAKNTSDLEDVETSIRNQTLHISYSGNRSNAVTVTVSSPDLKAVRLSDGASLDIDTPFEASTFSAKLQSGATLAGRITAAAVEFDGKTGSLFNVRVETHELTASFADKTRVNLSGHAAQSVLRVSGDALLAARNFTSDISEITASGLAIARINAARDMRLTLKDNARISYFGMPAKVSMNAEAVSTVKQNATSLATTL